MLLTALLSLPSPPSPVIFEVGPFALRYYGLFIALGIAAATWLTGRELARKGSDSTLALDSLFFVVPLGFIGARLYHVVNAWHCSGSPAASRTASETAT
jgi:phosphatidylglycerol:prolipoprotein diacylglycerol transferase